jgi:hypothetical protein
MLPPQDSRDERKPLAPVKGHADFLKIKHLVDSGLVTREFAADVLAIDLTKPNLSRVRCGLLKSLPKAWSKDWTETFVKNLRQTKTRAAAELVENLTNPARSTLFHTARAQAFVSACREKSLYPAWVTSMVRYLNQTRAEVFASEISMNPRGQILEPGFRVVFPVPRQKPVPWDQRLDAFCESGAGKELSTE